MAVKRCFGVFFLGLAMAGCATDHALTAGRQLIDKGRVEEGLKVIEAVAKRSPNNVEYRAAYIRERDKYINQLLTQGDRQRFAGRPEDADAYYQKAVFLDSENARARAGMEAAQTEMSHRKILAEATTAFKSGNSTAAQSNLRQILAANPAHREARALARRIDEEAAKALSPATLLKSSLRKPVTLEFRETPLKSVFEVLSRTSGINFIFDRDVRADLKVTIFVRNTTIEDAIAFMLTISQLEKQVLNENTLLIFPNE